MSQIATISVMERQLATITTIQEGISVEARANKLRDAFILAENVTEANKYARICCEASVFVGELLGVDVKQGQRLSDASEGMNHDTKHRYRNMARVPIDERVNYYDKATKNSEIISKAGILNIWKKVQKENKQEQKKSKPKLPPMSDRYQLHHCSCEQLIDHVPAGSQDWIITDPPYPKEYLHTFSELSFFANHALKDGGLLICMSGHYYIPEVIERLGENLNYHWCAAYLTPGGQSAGARDKLVNTFWKPLFIYSKGTYKGPVFGDVSKSEVNDNDKDHHNWGQSVSGMNDIIERFTMPGDTVVDPFLGGGTTCISSLLKDRLFIGCDIDNENINETLRRVENVCQ